jgi:Zn-dependent protease
MLSTYPLIYLTLLFKYMSQSGKFGGDELFDLLLSWIVLVIAFSVVLGGRRIPGIELILISALGVGTGFLLHEMAHKFMAQRYGYWAEYRANRGGLLFIIVMSLMGLIFAAPGAVMIHKPLDVSSQSAYLYGGGMYADVIDKKAKKEELWIALAGPMTNIMLTAIFFVLLSSGLVIGNLAMSAFYFAIFINLNLAAFNLIPLGPLDGKKIFEANRLAWALVAVPTILIALSMLFGIGLL